MGKSKMQLDKQLHDSLLQFKQAYLNLVDTLHETTGKNLEGEGHRFDSIAGTHYPFNESFDELCIPDWVDTSLDNLKNK